MGHESERGDGHGESSQFPLPYTNLNIIVHDGVLKGEIEK
jgi:hypothetical protein